MPKLTMDPLKDGKGKIMKVTLWDDHGDQLEHASMSPNLVFEIIYITCMKFSCILFSYM